MPFIEVKTSVSLSDGQKDRRQIVSVIVGVLGACLIVNGSS